MAVPTSGTLSLKAIAQEALYGTYGSGTITNPIYLYDLVNGGNSAGSGNSYPTVNEDCLPNPAARLPVITTKPVSNVSSNSAQTGGTGIVSTAPITLKGIEYSTSSTFASKTTITSGSGTADFNTSITGLSSTTQYYTRAFAINNSGTGYGGTDAFFTGQRTLSVTTVTFGPGTTEYPTIQTYSVFDQAITYTFTFVGQTGGTNSIVSYGGVARAAGYTTPAISGNIQEYIFPPLNTFTVTEGSGNAISFKYTLLTAAIDAVPSSPNNNVTVVRNAPSCSFYTSVTEFDPDNIAGDNGKLGIAYSKGNGGTLQYNLNGGSWITPTQTSPGGSFVLTGFSAGSGTVYSRTIGVWPACTDSQPYVIENPFRITPTNVPSADPYFSVLGTTGTISTKVFSGTNLVLTTSANPVNMGSFAAGFYYVQVTQSNPSYSYPQVTIFNN